MKEWERPLYDELRRLFSAKNLSEVLTHSSFYAKEGKGNSRFVFAGMFVFKGMVAQVLYRYATGDGTQLQHILGNLFRKELLSNPDYQARVAAREEEKRAKRKAEIEARDAAKEALRVEKQKAQKEEARLRDAKRRKAQAEAKKRKAENAARAAAKAAKEAQPMSAKKRRYLEDKKKYNPRFPLPVSKNSLYLSRLLTRAVRLASVRKRPTPGVAFIGVHNLEGWERKSRGWRQVQGRRMESVPYYVA